MKTVIIINEVTDKKESTYQVKDEKAKEEVDELKKLYDDVSTDNQGDIVVWK